VGGEVLGEVVVVTAILDRLLHHSQVINTVRVTVSERKNAPVL
jgi:hypothetical protein